MNCIPALARWILSGSLVLTATWASAQTTTTKPEVGIQEHPVEQFLIAGATVVTAPGQVLEPGEIWIADGKILAVGTSLTVPAGTRRIELRGKTIYPGFVDAGIEVELPEFDATRGTPHWNPEITPERSVAHVVSSLPIASKLRKAGITTALIAPRDGIIKGTSAVLLASDAPPSESILLSDAAMHVKLTVTRGRSRDNYPSSPMGAVALARQTFLDAQWYDQAWRAYRATPGLAKPETNTALSALQHHIGAGKIVVFDALNEQYALRADAFAREFGLKAILRGSGQEYQLLDPIARTGRPIIVPLNFPKPPNVATVEAALDTELEELMHWELAPENPGRIAKAGIPMVLTSQGLSDPSDFLPQIRKAIARGLDPHAALAAITITPASLLHIDDQVGSIAAGRWANLIVASGSLWDEKSKIEEVWVRGERPLNAFQNATNVDGTWELRVLETKSAAGELKSWPSSMELAIRDSDKKLTASLTPPAKPAAAVQEPAPTAEPKSPSDAIAAPEAAAAEPTKETAEQPESKTETQIKGTGKDAGKDKGTVKVNAARWADSTLTGSFATESIDPQVDGVAQLSLAFLAASQSEPRWIGSIVWPDGTIQSVQANRKPTPPQPQPATAGDAEPKDGNKSQSAATDVKDQAIKKPSNVLSTLRYPFGALGLESIPAQPTAIVFQNTTLWTSGPQGILKEADMVIRSGKIEAIGIDLPVPDGATVVDASRWEISPGLIDCHSHMATDSGVNEGTQAVTAEVRIGDFINAEDVTLYRQLAGGLTSANILHGSANPIGGQNQVIKLRWGNTFTELKLKDAPGGIKFALGENVKQSNWGDGVKTRYPQSRMGVEQLFRDRFHAAQQYEQAWNAWRATPTGLPPRRDLELDALAEILRGDRWIHCHSYRQDEILGLLRVLDDFKITIGSLQHILEGYKVADAIAKHGATASSFSDWWGYKLEVYDAIPHNGALMHQQGIVVSFNSDDAELGRHMNHEAAKAIKYGGVEPAEALKFVTLNPAIQLRIADRVGSLEVGKDADFAVWSGSPLSVRSRCEQTWIDGRKYFDRIEDAALRLRDSKLHRELVQKILDSGESASERSALADDPSRMWPNHDEYCHHHHDEDAHAEEHAIEVRSDAAGVNSASGMNEEHSHE